METLEVSQALMDDPRVLCVYLFGSRAQGDAHPASDLDLAVLLDVPVSLSEELELRAEAVRILQRDDIDLVLLDQASPLLRYEVIAGGRRLFARPGFDADLYEQRVLMEYLDTAHLRATQRALARESAQP
jgi:predicted nucleotidyltransferase